VAIRPSKHSIQGFTLIEMIVTISIAGIIMAMAAPSLLSLNKPLRDGTLAFKSQLNLIRSKAISSNQAYRIRPRYPTLAEYKGEHYQGTAHNFIVEYAANCQVNTYGYGLSNVNPSTDPNRPYNATYTNGKPDGWQAASQFDLDLPDSVGVTAAQVNGSAVSAGSQTFQPANQTTAATVSVEAPLNWSICYDNRGIAYQSASLTLQDFQANNLATSALIQVGIVGGLDITTANKNGVTIPPSDQGNPVF
jgi:prepilin-type N-terminal cleavage/methylation domain-containing protein